MVLVLVLVVSTCGRVAGLVGLGSALCSNPAVGCERVALKKLFLTFGSNQPLILKNILNNMHQFFPCAWLAMDTFLVQSINYKLISHLT